MLNYDHKLTVTFIATKVRVGSISDNDIEAVKKSNCPAAQALLYAYTKIQGVDPQTNNAVNPNQENSVRNTVALKAEITLGDAVKLLNKFDNNQDTNKYAEKQEKYFSILKQYGPFKDLTPSTRAEAMALLKDASYSYIKTEVKCNLEQSVPLKTWNKKAKRYEDQMRKIIQSRVRHKLCGINELPTEDSLKSYAESMAPVDSLKWLEEDISLSSSNSTKESTNES